MAQYKHLPIYKTTYELLEMVTLRTRNFPRDFKYSLGDKIRNECIERLNKRGSKNYEIC